MQLIAPDILGQPCDACELSVAVTATAFAIGFLIWLLGWRGHRFWIVLAATIAAGIFWVYAGPVHQTQPLGAGGLVALGAGAPALGPGRVVGFASRAHRPL